METLDAGGQRIAYRTSSGSGPAVVFVHGNSSSSAAWARVLDSPFGRRFRILALDLPGHGSSAPAASPEVYSIPGYARVVADFAEAADAGDAVLVGWSLGGHIALSASTRLPGVRGIVVHGTPPVASAADLATAFLPNPAVATGFTGPVSREDAVAYARAQLAPGSPLPVDEAVAHILATDPEARAALGRSLQSTANADERSIVAGSRVPVAILHGAEETAGEPGVPAHRHLAPAVARRSRRPARRGPHAAGRDPVRVHGRADGLPRRSCVTWVTHRTCSGGVGVLLRESHALVGPFGGCPQWTPEEGEALWGAGKRYWWRPAHSRPRRRSASPPPRPPASNHRRVPARPCT
ncbi:alpha/beta hydrolase [Amycolatopsis rhabdoformis]|uniref:Alpha/beta hydrolase n=1 Tax=Amycolatopsis rhabdoformis TaxID=1448059 RepID=A0ABZ1IJR2_9PSEU|nr:alpha/beta hydrolase [Amycolatopsis rhabdoformis]WSE33814.1 alpha/beta hydrolase [Amycolatopsis rhabdoformis]